MDNSGAAAQGDAFLAGLENSHQAAAKQRKQHQDVFVSFCGTCKYPERNDNGGGHYKDEHAKRCWNSTQHVGTDRSSRKKRRKSRWGPQEGEEEGHDNIEGSQSCKKRKSRWAAQEPALPLFPCQIQLPGFVTKLVPGGIHLDPEHQALNLKLLDLNRKLQAGVDTMVDFVDDGPTRSPSPEPIYDTMGVRINTRRNRAREKLTRERQDVIATLMKRSPGFKPPADYKARKHCKKLYIPVKEFPGYSFMGLVIGPRGSTQKRMEKETGAKIVVRGRGSIREGRSAPRRAMDSNEDDLHVLVEADTEEAMEKAAGMVAKLLVPVEEGRNEHKKAQLRALAILNGTLRDQEEGCRLCGGSGHRQSACLARHSTLMSSVLCYVCGDGGHPASDCALLKESAPEREKMEDEYKNFLAELGGGGGGQYYHHGFYGPSPPRNTTLAPSPSVSSGLTTPPTWGGRNMNVGATPPPGPSGYSSAVEAEYERFMSEIGW